MPKTAQKTASLFEFISLSIVVVVLSLSMFSLSKFFEKRKSEVLVLSATVDLENERQFWLRVLTDNPSYRDGWMELSKIEKDLGNTTQSEIYKNEALEVDPNYFSF